MALILSFAPFLAAIITYIMGYKFLALLLAAISFIWNGVMIIRNEWLYKEYLQLFVKEGYKKDQFDYKKQYDVLLLKVWVINVRKYIDKTVEKHSK